MTATRKIHIVLVWLIAAISCSSISFAQKRISKDTTSYSTQQQAIAYLDSIHHLDTSKFWPNIKPALYLKNVRDNILDPFHLYEGRNTNFCAYAALSYLPTHNDPLTFVKFMINIYKNGKAGMGRVYFYPSYEVRQAAGSLTFKGEMDIRPADQLWCLVLADHFKGYLNYFDHHFDMGDENKFWAAVNFAKFNRMIKRLFNYNVDATGSDLIRPGFKDLFSYLKERVKTGIVFLYLNNTFLYKKSHSKAKFAVPTHFVLLLDISEADGMINITYWDYGGRSLQQVTTEFLHKIVFGISHCTAKTND